MRDPMGDVGGVFEGLFGLSNAQWREVRRLMDEGVSLKEAYEIARTLKPDFRSSEPPPTEGEEK